MTGTVNLSEHRFNVHSQNGEDGVIEALLSLCGIHTGTLVEIGAWDGKYLSNIHYIATKHEGKYKTVRVEPVPERFSDMTKNIPWNENNTLLKLRIVPSEKEADSDELATLNSIFAKYKTENIAVLSLDTDGPDFDIWKSLDLKKYRPAIVIIEFGNWTNPTALRNFVASFKMKGYSLAHVTGNFIFVDSKYGIKATEGVNELIRKSGNPELMLHFGQITQEKFNEIQPTLPGTDLHIGLAGEQLVEIERLPQGAGGGGGGRTTDGESYARG